MNKKPNHLTWSLLQFLIDIMIRLEHRIIFNLLSPIAYLLR